MLSLKLFASIYESFWKLIEGLQTIGLSDQFLWSALFEKDLGLFNILIFSH